MIGDVVGDSGLEILEKRLPALIRKYSADIVTVNGENAAAGFGLTAETLDRLLAACADVVTGGNHICEKRDFWPVLDSGKPVLRPANYAADDGQAAVPGRGWIRVEKSGHPVLVINLQGRKRLPVTDCPFRCFDSIAAAAEPGSKPIILVDFHAESTEEKEALAYHLDGRASLVAGTHTHVQTADERILPKGTGYITDLGMTGVLTGIIGMDTKVCLDRVRTQIAFRMECAQAGPNGEGAAVQGAAVEIDGNTGKSMSIVRFSEG